MDKVDEYVRAFDEANDFATAQVEELSQAAREDIDDLFRSADRRDRELWALLDADSGEVIGDYEDEDDRDLDWILGMGAMAAASLTQFTLTNSDDLILIPLAYREQTLAKFGSLDRAAMIAAGKRGGVTYEATTAFRAVKARYLENLETFRQMNSVDLFRALRDIGGLPAIEKTTADAIGYVARMTSYAAGSPQFAGAVSDLVEHMSTRALEGQTRRAIERLATDREVNGNYKQLLVWLCEGGKNTCEYCLARAGEIMTYEEWVRDGLPGADVCRGGDLCKCGLAAT